MNEVWTWRALGEVTIPGSTWNPRTNPRALIRYVDVSAISRDELRIVSDVELSTDNVPSRARKIVQTGDTIFATVRPTLRRIARIPPSLDGEIVSTAFSVLRPNPAIIHPDFLYFVMQLDDVMDGIAAMQTGASYPAVRDTDILNQAIPLPSLSDQQEIATALNLVRSAVLGQKKFEVAAINLKRSAMRMLFTLGLRGETQKETEIGLVPESWDIRLLRDFAERPEYGYTASASSEPIGPRLLRITDIQDGAVDWNSVPYCDCDYNIKRSKALKTDDIVVARIGATTGKSFIISKCPEAVFASYLIRLRTNRNIVTPPYLYHYMQTEPYWRHIDFHKGGRLKGGVNIPVLESLPVPLPSLAEQYEVVAILRAIDRKIDLHRRKRAVLEDLFKALLHKLMTGNIQTDELNLEAVPDNLADANVAKKTLNKIEE